MSVAPFYLNIIPRSVCIYFLMCRSYLQLLSYFISTDSVLLSPSFLMTHASEQYSKTGDTKTLENISCLSLKLKLSLCFFLTEHRAMKAYWGMEV